MNKLYTFLTKLFVPKLSSWISDFDEWQIGDTVGYIDVTGGLTYGTYQGQLTPYTLAFQDQCGQLFEYGPSKRPRHVRLPFVNVSLEERKAQEARQREHARISAILAQQSATPVEAAPVEAAPVQGELFSV
jgi:hypothetical protein